MKPRNKFTEKDVIKIIVGDWHCGSDRAILPPSVQLPPLMADDPIRTIHGSNQQVEIYKHLMSCADNIAKKYATHKKVFVFHGDMIEGIHHHTIQLSAPMVNDHVIIHKVIASEFLERCKFSVKNGDELHYVSGTETHTVWTEGQIAKEFDVYNAKFHDEFKSKYNGIDVWYVHQWVGVGNGHNEGSAIVNALKAMFYNSLKEIWNMPNLVVAGHFHKSGLASFSQNFKTFYGIVTPSLQRKTRHGQKVSAFQRNDIGIQLVEITAGGLLNIIPPMLMK